MCGFANRNLQLCAEHLELFLTLFFSFHISNISYKNIYICLISYQQADCSDKMIKVELNCNSTAMVLKSICVIIFCLGCIDYIYIMCYDVCGIYVRMKMISCILKE